MTERRIRLLTHASDLSAQEWDACAGTDNPFVRHAFFRCLEDSGSAVARAGWQACHLMLEDAGGQAAGIAPAYLKSHSQGEYVFDHSWADAFERAGGRYYPKLQVAVPFSPVPGPRLLLRETRDAPLLLAGLEAVVEQQQLSSAHVTFLSPEQLPFFAERPGWLIRIDQQFHWHNRGYGAFDDFLASLASRKRKDLRKERAAALSDGVSVLWLTGTDITEAHWDAFWRFYQDTGQRKWGRPYLTRSFFSMLGATMRDKVLLVLAVRGGKPIAGALNLIGADTLYGRYWGAIEDRPFLHFEICYYQAIDYAIAHGLSTVEAGAQGAHKLARGYEPTPTYSAHWIAHPGFRTAVADYLDHERAAVANALEQLSEATPFRKTQAAEQDETSGVSRSQPPPAPNATRE